jgi:septal ring factor EnvC (AmiA/AmiB activator)
VEEGDTEEDDENTLIAVTNHEVFGTVIGKKDRRRTQNRLAQRAFRSRSKVHKVEVSLSQSRIRVGSSNNLSSQAANHLQDLEKHSIKQASRLSELAGLVDRLQKENSSLKSMEWDDATGSGALGSYMSSLNRA